MGYFAFLRGSEFTVESSFDPSRHLASSDIAVDDYNNPSLLSIHLRQSKMDQHRVGISPSLLVVRPRRCAQWQHCYHIWWSAMEGSHGESPDTVKAGRMAEDHVNHGRDRFLQVFRTLISRAASTAAAKGIPD